MRQSMTIRVDQDVLAAAKRRAKNEKRTLTNYIETLLRRDLSLADDVGIQVTAPADIREYEPAPIAGETAERHEFRRRLFSAILDAGGHECRGRIALAISFGATFHFPRLLISRGRNAISAMSST